MNKVMLSGLVSLVFLSVCAPQSFAQPVDFQAPAVTGNTAPEGGAPGGDTALAPTGKYTGGDGDTGSSWNNGTTSEPLSTAGNKENDFYVQPPDTTHTADTKQHSYQGINSHSTGTRLLAPLSTMQYGDSRSFKWVYDLGFPSPKGVSFSTNAMNENNPFFGPGIPFVPIGLPDTGTPSVNADVTIGGGY